MFCNVSSQAYGNLHVFCYNVSPKHLFLQCFQCSGIQKPCKILLCTMFFIFGRFSIAGKLPKWPKNSIFNTLLRSDTQKSSKNVENTTVFWSRCETVFGPPSPAKADIATAILTNVIEHLVLLFCPPISTPSPPTRCGRIWAIWATNLPTSRIISVARKLPSEVISMTLANVSPSLQQIWTNDPNSQKKEQTQKITRLMNGWWVCHRNESLIHEEWSPGIDHEMQLLWCKK